MDKHTKRLLDEIAFDYGTENINATTVAKELTSDHQIALLKYGTKIGTNIYKLDIKEDVPEVKKDPYENNKKITNFTQQSDLVPMLDGTYVPFGCYNEVLTIVKSNIFLPIYIVGESGNGKTMGVEQACAAVNRELVCFNLTNETTEEDLIGSFILDNGNMIWKDGPVLVAMRRGAVLLLDEIDQATTNVMCLQNVLQNKPYYVKKTNEMIKPEPGFTIVATANTKGDGDGSDRFVGANVMNEAFLERFNVVIEQDYPPPITEVKILKQHCTDDKFILSLVRWAKLARDNYKIGSIERCITTRRLVQIARNYSVFNNKNKAITYALNRFDDAVKEALFEYYTSITALTKYDDNLDFDIQYI